MLIFISVLGFGLFVAAIVSGIIPGVGGIFGFASILFVGVCIGTLARSYQKIFFIFIFIVSLSAIGTAPIGQIFLISVPALLFGNFFFSVFLKNHAPFADTVLIGITYYAFLFLYGATGLIGAATKTYFVPVAYQTLFQSAGYSIPFLMLLFVFLVLFSNYSKYGAIL